MAKRKDPLTLPEPTLPALPSVPRNPPGWGRTEVAVRRRSLPFLNSFREQEPAGDPPGWWKAQYPGATRPEWAVWWGLERNGKQPNLDFVYRQVLMGLGVGYYSTVDFMLPRDNIALEVQGDYWHYFDAERQYRDIERFNRLTNEGINLIFIDEEDALKRPIWIVQEALALRDHSRLKARM